jgi:hypothetical protein
VTAFDPEVLKPPTPPPAWELIICADDEECDRVNKRLRQEGRDKCVVTTAPGRLLGQRFSKVYCSSSIGLRINCSDRQFDAWFNEHIRSRMTIDGEIIMTP